MKRHQMMTLFNADIDTYYPAPTSVGATTYWGASTDVNDWVFGDGVGGVDGEAHAVLRAILVSNTQNASQPRLVIWDGDDNRVMFWDLGQDYAQDLLHGPHGVRLPRGFYVTVENNGGAYVMIVYDVA